MIDFQNVNELVHLETALQILLSFFSLFPDGIDWLLSFPFCHRKE